MFDTFKNRLELAGTLTTVTALRIGAGRSTEPIGCDLPVLKDSLGQPLIPGSSFKGAMRSRLESFLRGIHDSLAVGPSELTSPHHQNEIKTLKQRYGDDATLTNEILQFTRTDRISYLFGAPWLAGKLQIRDLTIKPDDWFDQYEERDGVAIDRDTETAAEGKLYDFQVVPAGTSFVFQAVIENAEDWELGLLMIGLHQFEQQMIPLGGGRSRGLGVVELSIDHVWWVDCRNNPQALITYLQDLVNNNKEAYRLSPETFAADRQEWTQALITHLNQYVSGSIA
ncbi:type III CRISPR-associated RAMP protein Csx7 [Trichothermofontia sp.]